MFCMIPVRGVDGALSSHAGGCAMVLRLFAFSLALIGAVSPAFAHHVMGGALPSSVLGGFLSGLGHPLIGRLEAVKAGHALHAAVAQKLLRTPDAFELVESPFRAGLDRVPATAPDWKPAHL